MKRPNSKFPEDIAQQFKGFKWIEASIILADLIVDDQRKARILAAITEHLDEDELDDEEWDDEEWDEEK